MVYSDFKNIIISQFKKFIGVDLSDEQCHCFFVYMNFLIEKNKVMNLTAITDPLEIILRHFIDSAMPVRFFSNSLNQGKYIVDIGTGAGFPGLPLALLCPNSSFVLNDTLGKRINFLSELVSELCICNVSLVKDRVEDFAHRDSYREKFDFVFSRGVSRFSILSEYSLPLLSKSGKMIAFKMSDCDKELSDASQAISCLGGMFHVKHPYSLIENEPERCLIEISKIHKTPKEYPRKAGIPAKNPL